MDEFVRVHGPKNQVSRWILRKEDLFDVRGRRLSPEELFQKFSLTEVPTEISKVEIPRGTVMRIGAVNPRKGVRSGNVVQYDLMKRPPENWFKNGRALSR